MVTLAYVTPDPYSSDSCSQKLLELGHMETHKSIMEITITLA